MSDLCERAIVVKVFRSTDELEQIRDFWSACRTHRDAQRDFYFLILETYPTVLRPHVLVAYEHDRPIAILLGRSERRSVAAKIGYFNCPTPQLRLLVFPHGGRLGDRAAQIDRLFVESINDSLQSREADAAMLHFAPVDSSLYRFALSLPRSWARDRFPSVVIHRARRLPAERSAFIASLSSKERNNQKRRRRRLAEEFGDAVRIDSFPGELPLDQLAADAEIVTRASYQRALGVGFHDSPAMRRRLALEAEKGSLRSYILYLANRPCAYWIASFHDAVLYSDFFAYDPKCARYAPGMFLLIDALEQFCADAPPGGDVHLDFGMGEMEWKEILSDRQWREGSVFIYGPSWRGAVAKTTRLFAAAASHFLRGLLAKAKLLSWVKKSWRSQATGRIK